METILMILIGYHFGMLYSMFMSSKILSSKNFKTLFLTGIISFVSIIALYLKMKLPLIL